MVSTKKNVYVQLSREEREQLSFYLAAAVNELHYFGQRDTLENMTPVERTRYRGELSSAEKAYDWVCEENNRLTAEHLKTILSILDENVIELTDDDVEPYIDFTVNMTTRLSDAKHGSPHPIDVYSADLTSDTHMERDKANVASDVLAYHPNVLGAGDFGIPLRVTLMEFEELATWEEHDGNAISACVTHPRFTMRNSYSVAYMREDVETEEDKGPFFIQVAVKNRYGNGRHAVFGPHADRDRTISQALDFLVLYDAIEIIPEDYVVLSGDGIKHTAIKKEHAALNKRIRAYRKEYKDRMRKVKKA